MNNGNFIHPTAIVEEGVVLGKNNYIGPFCYIKSNVDIGSNNRFEAYCSIGTAPEHREYFTEYKYSVVIGDSNVFREYVTVNAGSEKDTIVRNNVTMLRGSHIGHDSEVWDKVTLSCNTLVGGHSIVMEGVNMGLGSICHQFAVLGPYAMIGMGGVITKSSTILPGKIYAGVPVKLIKDNIVGIQRSGLSTESYGKLKQAYEDIISMP
jgi:UDP-N-acetylglucosamine acyltransferase